MSPCSNLGVLNSPNLNSNRRESFICAGNFQPHSFEEALALRKPAVNQQFSQEENCRAVTFVNWIAQDPHPFEDRINCIQRTRQKAAASAIKDIERGYSLLGMTPPEINRKYIRFP